MFAAVNGNVVQVYALMSFENIVNLKGHKGKVRAAHSLHCWGRIPMNSIQLN